MTTELNGNDPETTDTDLAVVETTPGGRLARAEAVACSFLARESRPPLAERLSSPERAEELADLVEKLGHRYALATLANYTLYAPSQLEVIRRLETFAEKMPDYLADGGGLLLYGAPGTGKDHLLAALLKLAVVMHGFTVDWWDGLALFADARHAISEDRERDLIRGLIRPQVLAISDPQPPRGDLSDFQIRLIREAIDRRYRAMKSTWITTNIDDREDAEKLLTKPLMERLKESGGQVYCDWSSYRERRQPMW